MRKLSISVVMSLFLGCQPSLRERVAAVEAAEQRTLRTYEVPAGQANQLRAVLERLFFLRTDGKSDETLGRLDVTPDGRLAVMAPAQVQEGVKDFLESVAKRQLPPAVSVQTTYWLVTGRPGKAARPTELAAVGPALDQLEQADGPQQFELEERLMLTQMSGEHGQVAGRLSGVRQSVVVSPSGVALELVLDRTGGYALRSRVSVQPGQFLVLGSAGVEGKDKDARTLYVIIRATST